MHTQILIGMNLREARFIKDIWFSNHLNYFTEGYNNLYIIAKCLML